MKQSFRTTTAPVMSREDGYKLLEPYFTTFWEWYTTAWDNWLSIVTQRPIACRRSRASLISYFAKDEVKRCMEGETGVTLSEKLGFLTMRVVGKDGTVANLRLKKLNRNLRPSNIPTQQQIKWDTLVELPGMPPEEARLVIGYTLTKRVESAVEQVVVAYLIDGDLIWYIDIPNPNSDGGMRQFAFPTDAPDVPSAPTVRVKDRAQATEEQSAS